jgi:signal transduction histidine kinase
MIKKVSIMLLSLLFCCTLSAQESQKSDLHKRAEAVDAKQHIATARSMFIHAFNDYANKSQTALGVECATQATALYYKENFYKEAFDLLRRADQVILADKQLSDSKKAALFYQVTKERMQMYMKLKKSESAKDQLNMMETLATRSADDAVKNDLLYTKAIYYYTFGMNAKGNEVFKEMADKLTAAKDYDKVDEVYKTLIANGRRSNNASMVAQSYSNYMAWKDSTSAIKHADEISALKQQIADNEASIADKDGSLTTRMAIIVGLCILAGALAVALVVGAIMLLRYIVLTRKQKKTISLANESNALKAKFISNISAQLEPTLQKLDSRQPEVKALLDFSSHIQTLSEIENSKDEAVELQNTSVPPYCDSMMDQIRQKVKKGVILTVNAPKMSANLNKQYVSHILTHLLNNAAEHTPEGGTISLEYKKRGPQAIQFLVSNTGETIAEELREDVFKPFREIRDLTQGDGLGLPICKQMALKMNGDLEIDPQYTKGVRFVLNLHS